MNMPKILLKLPKLVAITITSDNEFQLNCAEFSAGLHTKNATLIHRALARSYPRYFRPCHWLLRTLPYPFNNPANFSQNRLAAVTQLLTTGSFYLFLLASV